MSDYSHEYLMEVIRGLGYSFDSQGVCAGIAEMATQAFLCGAEEFARYCARIDFIAAVTDPEELREKIAAVKEVVKKHSRKLSEDEIKLLEIEAFCEGILLYLMPITYKETLGTSISQPKVTEIAPLVASRKLEELGGTRAVTSFPGTYTSDEMTKYAEMLQQMALRSPPCDLSFGLDSMNHRISLYYSSDQGKWILNDANKLPPFSVGTAKELGAAIYKALALTSSTTTTPIGFNTTLYTTHKNELNKVIVEKAILMKRSENYRSLHSITPELATRKITTGHGLSHLAAKFNHPEVIKELAALGADLNEGVRSPIHIAAELNHVEVLSALLDSGVNVNAKDGEKNTPAYYAARDDFAATMKLLIAHGADLDIPNDDGWKPIHVAAQNDCGSVIEEIANSKSGADLLIAKKSGQYTPLWLAAGNGSRNAVRVLLQKLKDKKIDVAAHVNETDHSGVTALMKAAEKGSAAIVAALLAAGADINATDSEGRTAAHYAAKHNDAATMKLLIARGANLEIADADGLKPIHVAAKNDADNVIKEIAHARPGIDTLVQKPTLLSLAARSGSEKVLAVLLQQLKDEGADVVALVNETDSAGVTALMNAAEKNSAMVAALLDAGADINAKDSYGRTVAHYAAKRNYAGTIKLLIAKGANLDIPDNLGWKPIHTAAENNCSEVIKEIASLRPGADFLISKLSGQYTLLWIAASKGSRNAVRVLLQKLKDEKVDVAAHVNETDSKGVTALMKAAEKNSTAIVAALLAAGADINAKDSEGRTAAHYAAKHNDAATMKLLIAKGADLDIPDDSGEKPIHIAVDNDCGNVIEEIANSRPGPDFLITKLSGQYTPLWLAAGCSSQNAVRVLLQKLKDKKIDVAAHVNETDSKGVTALMKAAELNSAAIVQALLDAGADINQANDQGRTAIFYAVSSRSIDVLRMLIERKAKLNIQNSSGLTPLHLAAISNNTEILKLLYDVNVNTLDSIGKKAIGYVSRSSPCYELLQIIAVRQQLMSCCEALKRDANDTTLKLINKMEQVIHTQYLGDETLLLPEDGKINPYAPELLNAIAKCSRIIGPESVTLFSKIYPDLQMQIKSETETAEFLHFKEALQQKLSDLMKDTNRTPGSRFFIQKSVNYELIEELSKKVASIASREALLTNLNSLFKDLVSSKSTLYLTELSSFFDVNVETVTKNNGLIEEQLATKISKELQTFELRGMMPS